MMLEKIEVGKEYIDEDSIHIKVLDIGNIYVIGHDVTSKLEYFIPLSEAKEEWSELPKLPKSKVKKAIYLYKIKHAINPVRTNTYYKDTESFLTGRCEIKSKFDFILRLDETELEFDN